VTPGGRRAPVDRPRTRTVDGHEVPLTSYTHFAVGDMLTQVVMEPMLAGAATRRHARTAEPGAGRAAAGLRTGSPHARRIVIAPAPMRAP
jgi:putative transposase